MNHKQSLREVAQDLEQWHGLFAEIWRSGEPEFTDKVPTAAISYNFKTFEISFLINPEFWDKLSRQGRVFVIAHECLHSILSHPQRIHAEGMDPQLGNIAADLVVNHKIEDGLGISRTVMDDHDRLCWVETVFPGQNVPTNLSLTDYYYLVKQEGANTGQDLMDDHSYFEEGSEDSDGAQAAQDAIDQIVKGFKCSEKEMQKLEELGVDTDEVGQAAGDNPLGNAMSINYQKYGLTKNWESIIKKWVRPGEDEDYDWRRENRRMPIGDLMIPAEVEDAESKNKINVWFFQDTSGSCAGFIDHFYNAAMTFPAKYFNTTHFCFDTKVYPVDPAKREVKGGGGTCFRAIERYIQENATSYPDAVFVFTDGDAAKPSLEFPERWHWFLEGIHKTSRHIPQGCEIHQLQDFVNVRI